MTVYRHLSHALRILRTQPDRTQWGPLIDLLTPEEQAEVRPWLRERYRIAEARALARDSKGSQPRSSPVSSTKPGTRSRPRKAAQT
jgi:hypothetical protein